MAAGGIYTMGGAFWEFGQPDWERTNLFMLFGVAEDHDSNPIKMGLGRLKERGAKVIGVNPIRTGYKWCGATGMLCYHLTSNSLMRGRSA